MRVILAIIGIVAALIAPVLGRDGRWTLIVAAPWARDGEALSVGLAAGGYPVRVGDGFALVWLSGDARRPLWSWRTAAIPVQPSHLCGQREART